jgi:hypothetical protein
MLHEPEKIACTRSNGARLCSSRMARASQGPAVGRGFLAKGEHVHFVLAGQPPDQRQQHGNDAKFAGAIDAARHDECQLHGVTSRRTYSSCA